MPNVIKSMLNIKEAKLPDIYGTFIILISLLALLGWASGSHLLVSFSIHDHFPTMKVNTAIAFLMLGMGLITLPRHFRQPTLLAAVTVLFFSGCAVTEYQLAIDLGVNNLFFTDIWSTELPGRMAPASAYCLGLAAILFITHDPLAEKHPKLYGLMQLALLAFALFGLSLFLYGTRNIDPPPAFVSFSLPTTICMLLFSLGLITATKSGLAGLLTSNSQLARLYQTGFITAVCFILIGGVLSNISNFPHATHTITLILTSVALLLVFGLGLARLESTNNSLAEENHKLKQLNQTHAALLDVICASDDGIILVDERRRIVHANQGASKIFGWQPEEFIGKPAEQLIPKRYRKKDIREYHHFVLSNERTLCFDYLGKTLGLTARGHEKPLSISLHKSKKVTSTGEIIDLCKNNDDETSQKESKLFTVVIFRELCGLQTELAERNSQQRLDSLTGLPNYQEFVRFSEKFSQQTHRKDESELCIMLIDLDSFKLINHRYGRDFGDRVIQSTTSTLKHRLRATDKLFRYRTDEFVLIASNTPLYEAEIMAERMRTSVKVSPTKLEGRNVYITCSIGLMVTDGVGVDLNSTVEQLCDQLHNRGEGSQDQVTHIS